MTEDPGPYPRVVTDVLKPGDVVMVAPIGVTFKSRGGGI
jgi:hypothetical protein